MLILFRREGEEIICHDGNGTVIRFTILPPDEIQRKNQVKIGIDAPSYISIDRREIYEAKLRDGVEEDEQG